MKLGLNRKINQSFEQKGSNITIDDIETLAKNEESNLSIENILFSFVHFSLDRYESWPHLDYVYQSIKWIGSFIEKDLYDKKIEKQLNKVLHKLNLVQKQNSEQVLINPEDKILFKKIEQLITNIIENYQEPPDNSYQSLNFLITDIRNISQLEKLFNRSPELANCIDEDGNTIFYNLFKKEIEIIQHGRSNQKDIAYYYEILKLMYKSKRFHLPHEQKKDCIKKLKSSLKKIKITFY